MFNGKTIKDMTKPEIESTLKACLDKDSIHAKYAWVESRYGDSLLDLVIITDDNLDYKRRLFFTNEINKVFASDIKYNPKELDKEFVLLGVMFCSTDMFNTTPNLIAQFKKADILIKGGECA